MKQSVDMQKPTRAFFIVALAIAATMAVSCGNKEQGVAASTTRQDTRFTLDTINGNIVAKYEDTLAQAEGSTGGVQVALKIELPLPDAEHADTVNIIYRDLMRSVFGSSMLAANDTSVEQIFRSYASSMAALYEKEHAEEGRTANGKRELWKERVELTQASALLDGRMLNFTTSHQRILSATDSTSWQVCMVYCIDSCRRIVEQDLFLMSKQVETKLGTLLAKHSPIDVKKLDFPLNPNNNFSLNADGMVYHYNFYELYGSNVQGIDIALPWDELRPILAKSPLTEPFSH